MNTFIQSRSFLETHTQFQTKMGKVYTHFQTKTAQKPYLLGRHIHIWFIQLFRERLSEKEHATIPKGIVAGFEFTVL